MTEEFGPPPLCQTPRCARMAKAAWSACVIGSIWRAVGTVTRTSSTILHCRPSAMASIQSGDIAPCKSRTGISKCSNPPGRSNPPVSSTSAASAAGIRCICRTIAALWVWGRPAHGRPSPQKLQKQTGCGFPVAIEHGIVKPGPLTMISPPQDRGIGQRDTETHGFRSASGYVPVRDVPTPVAAQPSRQRNDR